MTPETQSNTLGAAIAKQPFRPNGADWAHVFSDDEILAIKTAQAAGRALLVRGEPGTGKTQLAMAAAAALDKAFVSHTVDSRTEARDLLWHFDAVSRLAKAQTGQGGDLPEADFIQPRALWWAFDWAGAAKQADRSKAEIPSGDPKNGVVVLIDEIDKAESEAPNGLLEALGSGRFTPQGFGAAVERGKIAPLVIITTNEERTLPDAFIRRCLVLHLNLPDGDALVDHLVVRGQAHFLDADAGLLKEAATQVAKDRVTARDANWRPFPGPAEYIDLVRAVRELAPNDAKAQGEWLAKVSRFALHKHADAFSASKL